METSKRKPQWNIASAVFQPVGIFSAFVAAAITSKPESLDGLFYAVPTYAFFSLFGVVAGIAALIRNEQWQSLSWIALFLNTISFLLMVSIIARKVHF